LSGFCFVMGEGLCSTARGSHRAVAGLCTGRKSAKDTEFSKPHMKKDTRRCPLIFAGSGEGSHCFEPKRACEGCPRGGIVRDALDLAEICLPGLVGALCGMHST